MRNNTFYQMTNVDRRIKDIAHRINPGFFMGVIGTILINGCTPIVKVLFFAWCAHQLAHADKIDCPQKQWPVITTASAPQEAVGAHGLAVPRRPRAVLRPLSGLSAIGHA